MTKAEWVSLYEMRRRPDCADWIPSIERWTFEYLASGGCLPAHELAEWNAQHPDVQFGDAHIMSEAEAALRLSRHS